MDSYLLCTRCGREATTDFAHSLREGWPKCCGLTMRLTRTDADIDAAVASLFHVEWGDGTAPYRWDLGELPDRELADG